MRIQECLFQRPRITLPSFSATVKKEIQTVLYSIDEESLEFFIEIMEGAFETIDAFEMSTPKDLDDYLNQSQSDFAKFFLNYD